MDDFGGPTQNESASEMAIRLMREQKADIAEQTNWLRDTLHRRVTQLEQDYAILIEERDKERVKERDAAIAERDEAYGQFLALESALEDATDDRRKETVIDWAIRVINEGERLRRELDVLVKVLMDDFGMDADHIVALAELDRDD